MNESTVVKHFCLVEDLDGAKTDHMRRLSFALGATTIELVEDSEATYLSCEAPEGEGCAIIITPKLARELAAKLLAWADRTPGFSPEYVRRLGKTDTVLHRDPSETAAELAERNGGAR